LDPDYLQGPYPAVSPNGDLFVSYVRVGSRHPGWPCTLKVARSTNGGDSFPFIADVTTAAYALQRVPQNYILGYEEICTDASTMMAINPINEDIYLAFTQSAQPSNNLKGYFARSTNHGTSWTIVPIAPANQMTGDQYWFWIAVDPTGRVFITFRHTEDRIHVSTYVIESSDGGETFGDPVEVSTYPTDTQSLLGRCHYIGNAAITGVSFPVWEDYRNHIPPIPPFPGCNCQADIYTASVDWPPAAPGNVCVGFTPCPSVQHPVISWTPNTEPDLSGYNVFKRNDVNQPWAQQNTSLITGNSWIDYAEGVDCQVHQGYPVWRYYHVTAVDVVENESSPSAQVAALVDGQAPIEKRAGGSAEKPESYALHASYPNPFNPTTQIKFDLAGGGSISLAVYNVIGRKVAELVNEYREAGYHSATWNAANVSSGVYFARFTVSNELGRVQYTKMSKLMLIR
jgi:hypothetical protein